MSVRCLAWLVLLPWSAAAAQKLEKRPLTPQQLEAQLHYQTGRIKVRNGLATLELPPDFRYLDARQAAMVLRAWGNPPGSRTLDMLLPASRSVFAREAWAIVITYDEDGYVKDDDAAKIDYGDLLKKMQQGIRDENDERKRAGYPAVELVGWAEPPRYDSASHKLLVVALAAVAAFFRKLTGGKKTGGVGATPPA